MSDQAFATVGVGEDDLVTGEAVALDLPAASVGMRILAGLLDYIIVQALLTGVMFLLIWLIAGIHDNAITTGVMLVGTLLVLVGYPTIMETMTRGRTVGKLAAGLRTLRDDAGPITFRHAFTRALIKVPEVYLFLGIPAIVACVISPRGKRLGDMAAGTFVVRERVSTRMPPAVPMPPHLASWAVSADIARLPDGLAMAVRTFLPAAFSMTPAVREQMGRQLYDEVMAYVSPPPPPGNHPEYVLAAVLADRRRRDLDRLVRDAMLRDRVIPMDPPELQQSAS
ncbi:MAG TPA: RDD family protein [Dermatophilaceae bacterium]|nr:RDD family protein [Dermatophilaceae bacterium]